MNYEAVINELFNRVVRYLRAQPLNLGGYTTVSGGAGGPPGGFQGYLPQTRVTFDESEAEIWAIPSGPTLVDNLNRIRYRVTVLESGKLAVYNEGNVVLTGVTVIDFDNHFTVTQTGPTTVLVSGNPVEWDDILNKPILSEILFLHEDDSDVVGYEKLLTTPASGIESIDTATILAPSTEYPIDEYITYPITGMGATLLGGGSWEFNTYTKVSNVAGVTRIVIRVYKRNQVGTETELFNVETDEINNTTVALNTKVSIQPDYVLDLADRLVVKYFAKSTVGASQIVSLYYEGTTNYSHIHIPGSNSSSSTGSGHTIMDEGIALTQRTNLNFVGAGVTVTDDSGNDSTVVTITATSSGTTISGTGELLTDDSILVSSIWRTEDLTSQIPTTSFTTISGFVPGTLKIYYNGIRQRAVNYTEGTSSFTTSFTTYSGDTMLVEYDLAGYAISTILYDDNGDVLYES